MPIAENRYSTGTKTAMGEASFLILSKNEKSTLYFPPKKSMVAMFLSTLRSIAGLSPEETIARVLLSAMVIPDINRVIQLLKISVHKRALKKALILSTFIFLLTICFSLLSFL